MTRSAVEDAESARSECWCCGCTDEPQRMVHLGNHPEVALCTRCSYWAAKQAWGIDDRNRSGPLVMARNQFRAVRGEVIRRGWHRNPLLRGPLRWIGKRLP